MKRLFSLFFLLFFTHQLIAQAEAIIAYGRELLAEGEYELALQQFELANDVDRGNIDARIGRGISHYHLGDYESSAGELQDLFNYGIYPQAEYFAGKALFKLRIYEKSLFHFGISLQRDTVAKDIFYYVGACKFEVGESENAISYLQTAASDSVAPGYAHYYLAQSYLTLDSLTAAKEAAQKAISTNSLIPRFHRALGDVY
ncbi:MAG: hypothetical protein HKN32_02255, partial [Flavobacteriales bacterium]|nr:hypothetical protein [Flavobacteriales bacterium]